jgi:hypothetical protein
MTKTASVTKADKKKWPLRSTHLLRTIYCPFPAFLLSASLFLNGNPDVRLSAPVFRLILPSLLAKRMHHSATAEKNALAKVAMPKLKTPV